MADVSFSSVGVQEVLSKVEIAYKNLETEISNMSKKTSSVNSFWSSKEQEKFSEAVTNLDDMVAKFNVKYGEFIVLLNSVIKTYGIEKEAILAALNKELSKNS